MNPDELVCRFACAAATLAGALLARSSRSPHHRPAALTLAFFTFSDSVRGLLCGALTDAPRPFAGLLRLAFHADTALLLGFPAAEAALAIYVFSARRTLTWLAFGVWAGVVLALAAIYPNPAIRGVVFAERLFLGAHLLALAVQFGTAVNYARRACWPGPPQIASIIIMAGDFAALAGPFLMGESLRDWWTGRWPSSIIYVALSVEQARRIPSGLAVRSREASSPYLP